MLARLLSGIYQLNGTDDGNYKVVSVRFTSQTLHTVKSDAEQVFSVCAAVLL